MIILQNKEKLSLIAKGGIKMVWFGEEEKQPREKDKEKLIDNYSVLVATFEEQKRNALRDKEIYGDGSIPILEQIGLADINDPDYRGNIQEFKSKVQGTRYGDSPMIHLMWKITDQITELNKVQVIYKIRLESYLNAMDIMLKSSFAMINRLEEEKAKLKDFLGAPSNKPARKYSPKELRGEVFKRLDMNQTQAQIAAELGIAQTYVSKIKREHYDKVGVVEGINTQEESVNNINPTETKKNDNQNQVYSLPTQNQDSEKSLNRDEKVEET